MISKEFDSALIKTVIDDATKTIESEVYSRPKATIMASVMLVNSRVESATADDADSVSKNCTRSGKTMHQKGDNPKGTLSTLIDSSNNMFEATSDINNLPFALKQIK